MYNIIPLPIEGEGHTQIQLGNVSVELVNRFNYIIKAWSLDILDSTGALLVAGIMLFPKLDLLKGHPDIKAQIGSLIVAEQNPEDYQNPLLLGTQVQLLWFPVGEEITFI